VGNAGGCLDTSTFNDVHSTTQPQLGQRMKTLVRNEVFDDRMKRQGLTLKRYFEALATQDFMQKYTLKLRTEEDAASAIH
jgi:hypothetical protein